MSDRFWSRVDRTGKCWVWVGRRNPKGYGQCSVRDEEWLAHRLSWAMANGPIPSGALILHHCDNPPCVRPDHLYAGTHSDNTRDMLARGRTAHLVGPPLAYRGRSAFVRTKLTPESVRQMRADRSGGMSERALASKFGVGVATAHAVVSGESWSDV